LSSVKVLKSPKAMSISRNEILRKKRKKRVFHIINAFYLLLNTIQLNMLQFYRISAGDSTKFSSKLKYG
jgi:hypothetical protein